MAQSNTRQILLIDDDGVAAISDFTAFDYDGETLLSTSKENSDRCVAENLGIYRYGSKGQYHTGRFAGYTWLKDKNGTIVRRNGKPVVLQVSPRFGLNITEMINVIAEDDEFEQYLCSNLPAGERMYTFFFDQPMIQAEDAVQPNHVIAIWSYIILLKEMLDRPLMTRIKKAEHNFTGKIKGKIQFTKQLNKNILQGHEERIWCSYNIKTEDIAENRMLKYALSIAEEYIVTRQKATANTRQNHKLLQYIAFCRTKLANVSEQMFSASDIDQVHLPIMYQHYAPLLQLAKVVIMESSADFSANQGHTAVIPYAINMPLLFECYCRTCVKQRFLNGFRMLQFVPDKFRSYDPSFYGLWDLDPDKKAYISGKIIPDIVLVELQGQKTIVYDVKYKAILRRKAEEGAEKKRKKKSASDFGFMPNRDDRLQLLAYANVFCASEVGHVFPNQENFVKEKWFLNKKWRPIGNDEKEYREYYDKYVCYKDLKPPKLNRATDKTTPYTQIFVRTKG